MYLSVLVDSRCAAMINVSHSAYLRSMLDSLVDLTGEKFGSYSHSKQRIKTKTLVIVLSRGEWSWSAVSLPE